MAVFGGIRGRAILAIESLPKKGGTEKVGDGVSLLKVRIPGRNPTRKNRWTTAEEPTP